MNRNFRNTYNGVKVRIDNQSFEECSFINCTIEYGGTGPISLTGCKFKSCNWVFIDYAQNTLNFMQTMYHHMDEFGKSMIEATFQNIKDSGVSKK